jgi:hypothetical protein
VRALWFDCIAVEYHACLSKSLMVIEETILESLYTKSLSNSDSLIILALFHIVGFEHHDFVLVSISHEAVFWRPDPFCPGF